MVRGPGDLALDDVPDPIARAGEVLVRPILSGVCGTDLELIDGTIDPQYVRYPLVLGHEWVGTLLEDVDGIAVAGDLVVVEGIIPCGECLACRAGATNRCEVYDEIGFTRPGGLAELIAVPAGLVHRIDPGVDPLDASLIEPMAVVWRALTRLQVEPGRRVAVVGDGTVGLLAAHLAGAFAPASVLVIGQREAQAPLAAAAGANRFATAPPDERFDLVIEAAGAPAAVSAAFGLVDRGGMLILLGLPPHGSTVAIAPDDIVNDDIVIQGSFSYTRSAWSEVVAAVNAGRLRPSFLVTHRYPMAQYEDAVRALSGEHPAGEPRGKVTIEIG